MEGPRRLPIALMVGLSFVGAAALFHFRGSTTAAEREVGRSGDTSSNKIGASSADKGPVEPARADVRGADMSRVVKDHLVGAWTSGEPTTTVIDDPDEVGGEETKLGPDLDKAPPPGTLGLHPDYLVPVPPEQRPTEEQLSYLNSEAEKARQAAPRPAPPDPNLMIGLLAAIRQVTENPALRAALANSYLDAVMGLNESEAATARAKLDEALGTPR